MHRIIAGLFGLMFIAHVFAAAPADPKPQNETAEQKEEREEREFLKSIDWKKGPTEADVGDQAKVKVPEGFMFTAGEGTRKLLEAMGNPTGGNELGFLAPTNMNWFVVFEFSDTGYVKDDDKDKLDPQKLLSVIKRGTEELYDSRNTQTAMNEGLTLDQLSLRDGDSIEIGEKNSGRWAKIVSGIGLASSLIWALSYVSR
jgi:uncharacterized membrane-anchored protein